MVATSMRMEVDGALFLSKETELSLKIPQGKLKTMAD